jgi:ribosomal protein S8
VKFMKHTRPTKERLAGLPDIIVDKNFLKNRGIGNEIGFYIFSYPPQDEPIVTNALTEIPNQVAFKDNKVIIETVNLMDMIIDILKEENLFEAAIELEENLGTAHLRKALVAPLAGDRIAKYITEKLTTKNPHVLLITGVGEVYPLVRSHTVLNNLHAHLDKIPVIMFFPGTYDGNELRLFGTMTDDNYYRAFPLLN